MVLNEFLFYVVWGLGVAVLGTILLVFRFLDYRVWHDHRSQRDFLEAVAVWAVSIASSFAIAVAFFGERGTGMGRAASLFALAAFAGLILLMLTDRPRRRKS